jgi:uncharacterized protein (DUF1697 family)
MPRYVAFLRGMNVGGHRVSSEELRGLFIELGFEGVASFRSSGNVIFQAGGVGEEQLTLRLQDGLAKGLGYEVPVFARTSGEVQAIAAYRPFDQELIEASAGKLQVTLLAKKPAKKAQADVLALSNDEDRLVIHGRELYWLPSGGILDSALDFKAIALLLGQSTTRTKATIDLIAAKFFA